MPFSVYVHSFYFQTCTLKYVSRYRERLKHFIIDWSTMKTYWRFNFENTRWMFHFTRTWGQFIALVIPFYWIGIWISIYWIKQHILRYRIMWKCILVIIVKWIFKSLGSGFAFRTGLEFLPCLVASLPKEVFIEISCKCLILDVSIQANIVAESEDFS
jgi:hypothetical protein